MYRYIYNGVRHAMEIVTMAKSSRGLGNPNTVGFNQTVLVRVQMLIMTMSTAADCGMPTI